MDKAYEQTTSTRKKSSGKEHIGKRLTLPVIERNAKSNIENHFSSINSARSESHNGLRWQGCGTTGVNPALLREGIN